MDRLIWLRAVAGGLVDGALARAATDCVTSVVLGKDWVPRLSLSSFERLRDEMVRRSLWHRAHACPDLAPKMTRCACATRRPGRFSACMRALTWHFPFPAIGFWTTGSLKDEEGCCYLHRYDSPSDQPHP